MTAYYNENDPKAAAWLCELIERGHIAPGVVDERSIEDVVPAELEGFTQCHFFAGIGVWSYALRRAGWPDDRPVWTGSCPCQPFSAAGKAGGFTDERHLWPVWLHLIQHGKPESVPVFGEQVASKDGLAWLDLVQTDLEAAGYACGAVDLCAAGLGAPHIRQRQFFTADWVGDSIGSGLEGHAWHGDGGNQPGRVKPEQGGPAAEASAASGLADADSDGCGARGEATKVTGHRNTAGAKGNEDRSGPTGPTNGFWGAADWLFCRDGKWRPVRPSSFPLVDGAAARVGRLRGYGNAINAEVATAFIEAYLGLTDAT